MALQDNNSSPRKFETPPAWRWFMRLTGALALALFLTPTVYVVKYYAADLPRERQRAQALSVSALAPAVPLNLLAPPLDPPAGGDAAPFYVAAIQSYADRVSHGGQRPPPLLPTLREASLLLEGGRRSDCHFFATDPHGRPRYTFHDPDDGRLHPYRPPLTARESYRYLSYAGSLAQAMRNLATLNLPDPKLSRGNIARAIIRFGDALGREQATRTHLAVAKAVQRIGISLLLHHPTEELRRYVDAQQTFAEAVQVKYARLERDTPDNLALQERVAQQDVSPLWRREAIWALGGTLSAPHIGLRRPLETLTAKAALSSVATHDPEASVRAAASATLGEVAQQGAVIRR